MSILIKHMTMPKGCIYANDKDQTEYCPLLNHDDVPFCQYIENEPESAIGIDERPVYCPLYDVPESCQDTVSRQAAIDTEGLDAQIRCEMCRNPMHTDRGCDGNCKYDEKLYERIMQILGERIKPLPSAQPEPWREEGEKR